MFDDRMIMAKTENGVHCYHHMCDPGRVCQEVGEYRRRNPASSFVYGEIVLRRWEIVVDDMDQDGVDISEAIR